MSAKINQEVLSRYINVTAFFTDYCPNVSNWKHKLRGKNGRNNPVEFTAVDLIEIWAGIQGLRKDLTGQQK